MENTKPKGSGVTINIRLSRHLSLGIKRDITYDSV